MMSQKGDQNDTNGTTSPSSYMVKHDRRTENGENTIYDCGQLIYIYKNF